MADNGAVVEVERLERRFGDLVAVNRISFSIQPGDIFAFVGPNGAGKTTTMRIVSTLDMPTSGDARINGVSVVNYPDRVRRSIGFMPEYHGVYTNLDVREYLDFFARSFQLRGRERREAVRTVMGFTDLWPLQTKSCDQLSKGMRQRLSLARTLIHEPEVLVLDEPAAGLDPRARVEFRELVVELARQGKAILISSHILTELSEICNVVGIIERGKLIAQGTVEEIRSRLEASTIIRLRVLDRLEEAQKLVLLYPNVAEVRVVGDELELDYQGDEEGRAGLLKKLVETGYRVTDFRCKEQGLEDIFMQITTGEVQ